MSDQWYVYVNDQKQGPVSEAQILQYIEAGKLSPEVYVWKQGMEDWRPANEVLEWSEQNSQADSQSEPAKKYAKTNQSNDPLGWLARSMAGILVLFLISGVASWGAGIKSLTDLRQTVPVLKPWLPKPATSAGEKGANTGSGTKPASETIKFTELLVCDPVQSTKTKARRQLNNAEVTLKAIPPDQNSFATFEATVTEGNSQRVEKLFRAGIANHREDGRTLIHVAAKNGWSELALAGINHCKIDPNAYSKSAGTPLYMALENENVTTARKLINAGASVNAQTPAGVSLLHWVLRQGRTNLAGMLVENGANISFTMEDGSMPLHWALRNNLTNFAWVLVEHGANVNRPDPDGTKPLDMAIQHENYATARKLARQGAESDREVSLFDSDTFRDMARMSEGRTLESDPSAETLTEYFGFDCPSCKEYSTDVFPTVFKQLINEDQVNVTLKHYPLNPDSHRIMRIHNAAECAADQDRFWQMKFMLIEDWPLDDNEPLDTYGMWTNVSDFEEFETCIKEEKYIETVEDQRSEARQNGIAAIPAFELDDRSFSGVPEQDFMIRWIEEYN